MPGLTIVSSNNTLDLDRIKAKTFQVADAIQEKVTVLYERSPFEPQCLLN